MKKTTTSHSDTEAPTLARSKTRLDVKIVGGSVVEVDDFVIPEQARRVAKVYQLVDSPTAEEEGEDVGQLPSFVSQTDSRSTPATSPATSVSPSVDVKTRSRSSTILSKMGIGKPKKTAVEKKSSADAARERAMSDPVSKSKIDRARYVKVGTSLQREASLMSFRCAGQNEREIDQGAFASLPRSRTPSPTDTAVFFQSSRDEYSQSSRSQSLQY